MQNDRRYLIGQIRTCTFLVGYWARNSNKDPKITHNAQLSLSLPDNYSKLEILKIPKNILEILNMGL